MKIGVFDSGIGGEAIANEIKKSMPNAELITVNDKKNVPYGDKTDQAIIELTDNAIQPLINQSCDIIVIACNTATAIAIDFLRAKYPNQKFIGIEPMIKTAAKLTKSNTITVCATPATLKSSRYKMLTQKYRDNINIIQPDCSTWAKMIEDNEINKNTIKNIVDQSCDQKSDVIVLGCTHYHWIKDLIIDLANKRAVIIEPTEAIIKRIKQIL